MTDLSVDPPRQQGFAARLRSASGEAHRTAETAPFTRRLLRGRIAPDEYGAFLVQLWHVYDALERASSTIEADPVLRRFAFDELRRRPSLEADLHDLLGSGWATLVPATPATERYVARIRSAATHWPFGVVAHQYVRYLGDLSGGQALRRSIERALDLPDGRGVRFFVFDAIADADAFKDGYRRLLDELGPGADEQERLVTEVLLAYRCNHELMQSLDELTVPRALDDLAPFTPDVVAAVVAHMNADHLDDSATICRAIDATTRTATVTGLGPAGVAFDARTDRGPTLVVRPWATRPVSRADIRHELVRMVDAAAAP